ncbi:MAG: sugar ABC transporter permease [Clostridia bacterium]|nr:sugar ABC transporter permease [Clostridia bacterium]
MQMVKKRKRSMKELICSEAVAPYVFALPFILSILIFFVYPIITTVIMSFQEVLPGQTTFIGWRNYEIMLSNRHFFVALQNSVVYTLLTLLVLIPLPMVLAALLNSKSAPGKNAFRSTLFVPSLTSVVVAGIIFRLILGDLDTALFNRIVTALGFEAQNWLTTGGQTVAYAALVVMATWRWLGVNMMYFLSGLEAIPKDLYESASIDGANAIQQFFRISVPMLRPVTIYVLTISIYGGMAMFTESFMLFNGNNSPMNVGLTIVGLLYRQGFEQNRMGRGAAIGLMLMVFTLIVNLIQLRATGQFRKERD